MLKRFALVAFVGLAACTTPQANTGIAAVETALTAAEKTATLYAKLPLCTTHAPPCSDAALVAKIKAADNTAYSAVTAARADAGQIGNAQSAVAALVDILAQIPTT